MHARQSIPAPLIRLAALQDGVVTREQVLGHGCSVKVVERLVRDGAWQPLARGLYLTAPGPPTWPALAWGGVLLGGDQARLGAEASSFLHGLVPEPPDTIDVLIPVSRAIRSRAPWQFIRETERRPRRSVGCPPRLPIEVALIEAAATRSPGDAILLVAEAEHRGLTSASKVLRTLDQYDRISSRKLLVDLLADVIEGAKSPLERTYLNDVERAHSLPKGRRQKSHLGLPYSSDVLYEEYALLVELDGRTVHSGAARFRDMWRDNQFAVRDRLTVRYGSYDLRYRPCAVAFQVHLVLGQRGWTDPFTRCRRCAGATDHDLLLA